MVNPVWTVTEEEMVTQGEMETEEKKAKRVIQEKMVIMDPMESVVHRVNVVKTGQRDTQDREDHPEKVVKAVKENQVIVEILADKDNKVHEAKMALMVNPVNQVVEDSLVELVKTEFLVNQVIQVSLVLQRMVSVA